MVLSACVTCVFHGFVRLCDMCLSWFCQLVCHVYFMVSYACVTCVSHGSVSCVTWAFHGAASLCDVRTSCRNRLVVCLIMQQMATVTGLAHLKVFLPHSML